MSDKKIIDGIDVSKCQHYGKCSAHCYVVDELCSDNPNCYYKQLKRLRQENSDLKEKNIKLQNRNQQLSGAITQNLIYIQKLEKIEPLAIGLKQTDYQHIRQVGEKILQIIRGEE